MSLNWKEVESILCEISPKLEGAYLQKIAQTETLAQGEAFVFSGFQENSGAWHLMFLLPMQTTAFFLLGKRQKFKMSKQASAFVMTLRKHLLGQEISAIEQLENERLILFHFANKVSLVCELIPKWGNLILLEHWNAQQRNGRCLANFRKVSLKTGGIYDLPKPYQAKEPKIRDVPEEHSNLTTYIAEEYLQRVQEGLFERTKRAYETALRTTEKKVTTALAKIEKDLAQTEKIDKYLMQGKLLTSYLYQLGAKKLPEVDSVVLPDFQGQDTKISLDTKINFSENADKLFKKAKKLQRAVTELSGQKEKISKRLKKLNWIKENLAKAQDEDALILLDRPMFELGITLPKSKPKQKTDAAKPFIEAVSSDGFTVLCGRNKIENRRVTFKEARGNDIWMHVKGKPGAHVVIKAIKNKSVPLSTLIEAAQLVIQYSKIGKDKKCEIDYTYRKYVKPIKGSQSEVTYEQNKTILVEQDKEKLKALLN